MKRNLIFLASAALVLCTSQFVSAQHNHDGGYLPCGTDEVVARALANNPQMKAEYEANEQIAIEQDRAAFANGYMQSANQRNGNSNSVQLPPLYVIPVVFHIIHDYGIENISDAQVLDQMRIFNTDYRKLAADTSSIVPTFQGIAADCQIEFKLAALDPNGNCTNGIDRIASPETYVGDDGSKLNSWPRSKYLNIWVVKAIGSGAAGYAYLPGTAPSAAVDGIIILSTYVGSIGTGNATTSRALVHEVGHFLNLLHVWGSSNTPGVSCGTDNVSDTPTTKGWTSCNLTTNDVCNNNVEENVQNFLDYSYCYRMFTIGQRTRMHNALNSASGQRSSLVSNASAIATGINNPQPCAPIADFMPNDVQYICAGSSVTFTDVSYNGQSTSYSWTFQGGTPSTSTDSVPTIQYNTPGTYSVALTVSNAQGNDGATRTNYIVVSPVVAQFNNTIYSEGFENASTFAADWEVVNPQSNGWLSSTTAAFTGTRSCRLDNVTSMAGQVDEIISPTIDLSVMSAPSMTFKVAFAQRVSTDADRLRVFVSTDCGQTWVQRFSKTGTNLSTSAAQSSAFVPTAAQWRTEAVTFNGPQLVASNVRVKFEFLSDGGNDIFIDDINIQGATGINDPTIGVSYFEVFPNPAQDNTMIEFSLEQNDNVSLEIVDLNGKVVQNVYSGDLGAGQHRFPIATAELSAGMYLVRLVTDEGKYLTKKLLVE